MTRPPLSAADCITIENELGAWFLEQLGTIENAHIVEIRGRGKIRGVLAP